MKIYKEKYGTFVVLAILKLLHSFRQLSNLGTELWAKKKANDKYKLFIMLKSYS